MASIESFRRIIPGADKMSDAEVVSHVASTLKIPPIEVANRLGFDDRSTLTGNELKAAGNNYSGGLYGLGEAIANATDLTGVEDWARKHREENELKSNIALQRAAAQGAVQDWAHVTSPSDLGSYVKHLGIQSAPYLAESLTGGLGARALMGGTRAALTAARTAGKVEEAAALAKTLERGQLAGSVAASYPSSVGDILSNQREQTGGKADLGSAAALGIPYAALNALGLEGAVGGRGLMRSGIEALDKVKGIKGGIARATVAGGKGAAEEALGETGQELANQAGRIAVDPNATFTDPEALERYKQSAIGGALLGGLGAGALGGWKRKEAPSNLLNPDTAPDDNAGNPSVNVSNPNVPLQDWINQQLNVKQDVSKDIAAKAHAKRQADIVAAMNEPSGRFANDANGIERELTMGEAADMGDPDSKEALTALQADHGDAEAVAAGLKPSKNAKRLDNFNRLVDMKHLGLIDQSQFDQSVEQLNASNYGAVAKVLDLIEKEHAAKQKQQAVSTKASEATQATPNVGEANVSPPVKTPVVSKSSIPSQRVDTAGGVASTGSTPAVGGGVSRAPINTLAPNAEVSLLSNQTSQPTANLTTPVQTPAPVVTEPVVSRKRRVLASALAPVQAFVAPAAAAPQVSTETAPLQAHSGLSAEDQVAIAQATGNDTDVKAQQEEDLGQRQEVTEKDRQDTRDAIFRKRFEKSENPARDIEIAQAYLTAQRNAPHKSKSAIKAEIAAQFGIGLSSIEKIGNPDALIRAGQALGIDYATTTDLFDAKTRRQVGLGGTETETGSVQSALTANGITSGETGNLGFGVENDLWKQGNSQVGDSTNALIEAKHNEITALLDTIEAKRKIVEETGVDLSKEIAEDEAKIAPLLKKIEEFHLKKTNLSNEVNRLTQRLIDLQKEASATGKDLSKEIADVNSQLSAANESFNKFKQANKPKEKKKGKKNALQESSTGEMDVQSETEDGGTLGEGNTESEDASEEDRYSENDKDSGWPQALESRSKSFYDAGELSDEFDGVSVAIGQLEDLGIEHTLDFVSDWKTINDTSKDAINGEISTAGGRYTITLNEAKLTNSDHAAETVTHEVAHAFDMAPHGGVYSSQPEMSFGLKDGVITPVGKVARELHNLYLTNAKWNEYLEYPFDTTKFPSIKSHVIVEGEAFAQAFSAYANPKNQEMMRRLVPNTAAFLDEVIKHVKSTKPLQLQTQPTSAKRSLAFRNRNASRGNQVVSNTNGLRGRGQDRLASQSAAQADKNKVKRLARAIGGVTGQQLATDTSNFVEKLSHKLYFLHDLVEVAKEFMPSVTRWYNSMANTVATRKNIEQDAEAIADQAGKLKDGTQRVNEFLSLSTTQQKWGYDPKFNGQSVQVDSPTAIQFNKLTDEEQAVVKAVFAHGEKMRNLKKQILAALGIDKVFASGTSLQGPYAPLMRFGNYIAVLKSQDFLNAEADKKNDQIVKLQSDPKHYVMRMFDTAGQAEAFAEANASKYALTDSFAKSESVSEGRAMNTKVLEKVLAAVGMDANTTPEARTAMEKLVKDIYFQSLDEHDARQSGLKRKNISGFDEDMMRSFLAHARSEAGFLSNMKHGKETNAAFYAMGKEVKGPNGKREHQNMFNTISAHYADSFKSKETPWQDRAMAMTSAWQLSTSLGYHVTNATQTAMVTVPKLASDFNDYSGAWSALIQGYKTLKETGMWGNIKVSAVKDEGLRGALQRAADLGVLDMGMDADLGKFDAFKTGLAGVDNTSAVARRALQLLRQVSRAVETANRVASGTAAYNMARKHGQTVEQAQQYAVRVIQSTQGDSSRLGSPLLLKQLPKVVGQYKKYQFTMAGLYVKAFHDAFISQDKVTRAVGRRMLGYKLFHTSVAAGVLGFPLMNLAAAAFSALGGDDEPEDLERSLRDVIGDEDMADLLLHGPLAYMGLDMSAKLGEDKIFSILPYGEWDFSSASGLAKTAFSLAGPAVSQAAKFADGIGFISRGDYQKGIEKFMPSGVASALKAFREANDGYTLKNGDVMYQPEDINSFALALESVGMPSTQLKKMDWMRSQQYEIKRFYIDRTKQLEHDYDKAYREQDTETMDSIRESWLSMQEAKDENRKYFNNNPHELRRQPLSNLLRYPFTKDKRESQLQQSSNFANGGEVRPIKRMAEGGEVSYEADRVVGNPESVAPYGTRWITSPSDPVTAKGSGYFGILPNKFEGGVSSELSADNEKGSYPLISPTLTKAELNGILANKATDEAESKARAWQKVQLQKGQDPFAQKLGLRFPQPTE